MDVPSRTLGAFISQKAGQTATLATELVATLKIFPWRNTAAVLRERFREDQLGLTASSLTFTTMIALVPLFTVVLAVFTAFPMFAKMQGVLQQWLVESLIPDNIARNVLGYLTQFASKASRLGALGLALLLASALALILTIDRTLNNIWRVKRPRPFAQRVLVYWAVITLGPLLLAASLTITSLVLPASKGAVATLPGGLRFLLGALQFAMVSAGVAALFRYVPHTHVKWVHAWSGAVVVALGFEAAKKLLAIYLASVPTYSAVYGAFATAPILLLWIYIAWVIVLLGAVIAAYLPSLLQGVIRRGGGPGWRFQLAVEVLQQLHVVRDDAAKGLTLASLTARLMVDDLQLEAPLEALRKLDWIGQLESTTGDPARYVLLANPDTTELMPLVNLLLLQPAKSLAFVQQTGLQPNGLLRSAL
jgi:membrane protein